jgi:hypothetical protein
MESDPIVEETRILREQYARKFNHDIDAIYEDIQQRQMQSKQKPVSYPPRKPSKGINTAKNNPNRKICEVLDQSNKASSIH